MLQPREYQSLEDLMAHAGSIVTRTMLLREIRGFHFDPATRIIDRAKARLAAR